MFYRINSRGEVTILKKTPVEAKRKQAHIRRLKVQRSANPKGEQRPMHSVLKSESPSWL